MTKYHDSQIYDLHQSILANDFESVEKLCQSLAPNDSPKKLLIEAFISGNSRIIEIMLNNGWLHDGSEQECSTYLIEKIKVAPYDIRENHLKNLTLFLKAGGDLKFVEDKEKNNLLHMALISKNKDLADLLLSFGAKAIPDDTRMAAALSAELAIKIAKNGGDLNENIAGITPLEAYLIADGGIVGLKALVKAGANPRYGNAGGAESAATLGNVDAMSYFIELITDKKEKANILKKCALACCGVLTPGTENTLAKLLDMDIDWKKIKPWHRLLKAYPNWSSLSDTTKVMEEKAKVLAEKVAPIGENREGMHPLHVLLNNTYFTNEEKLKYVKTLIDLGADPCAQWISKTKEVFLAEDLASDEIASYLRSVREARELNLMAEHDLKTRKKRLL